MALPDIDFRTIRSHRGTQADAFEELCCQLAGDEILPGRAHFDRKGRGGDAGVECFATHDDGSETGWQVKFYWDVDALLASLDESLTTALEKHPRMAVFVACFPFDLADARRAGVKSGLAKWDEWRIRRVGEAAAAGRSVDIDRWDAYALRRRLTDGGARAAGRAAFWFDAEFLTGGWFRRSFERARAGLGGRYSPKTHVDLPIRRTIAASLRDPALFDRLADLAARIADRSSRACPDGDGGACAAAGVAAAALRRAAADRPTPFPLAGLLDEVERAHGLAAAWHARSGTARRRPRTSRPRCATWRRNCARHRGRTWTRAPSS